MDKGDLGEVLEAAMVVLAETKKDLKALREQVLQEFGDGQDTTNEVLEVDAMGLVSC